MDAEPAPAARAAPAGLSTVQVRQMHSDVHGVPVSSPCWLLAECEQSRVAATAPGSAGRVAQALEAAARAAQVAEMYKNCIKLAAENKISQKNTWSLNLIDHMSDLVKPDKEGVTTNFQHASCTLDAGIKIYSYRVDSVHSEAFKVLGGLSRSAGAAEDEADGPAGEGEILSCALDSLLA